MKQNNEEKRCWICHRTKKELIQDETIFKVINGIPEEDIMDQPIEVLDSKIYVCEVCDSIIRELAFDQFKSTIEEETIIQDEVKRIIKDILKVFCEE